MKKAIPTILLLALALSALSACGGSAAAEAPTPAEVNTESADTRPAAITGGWQLSESTEITPERQAVFDKAMEGLTGVGYEPVAYLGSQLVAGRNHAFLCRAQAVYPGAQPYYTVAYLYENLSGEVEITGFQDLALGQGS